MESLVASLTALVKIDDDELLPPCGVVCQGPGL